MGDAHGSGGMLDVFVEVMLVEAQGEGEGAGKAAGEGEELGVMSVKGFFEIGEVAGPE